MRVFQETSDLMTDTDTDSDCWTHKLAYMSVVETNVAVRSVSLSLRFFFAIIIC